VVVIVVETEWVVIDQAEIARAVNARGVTA
jgi:hypothetical protein